MPLSFCLSLFTYMPTSWVYTSLLISIFSTNTTRSTHTTISSQLISTKIRSDQIEYPLNEPAPRSKPS